MLYGMFHFCHKLFSTIHGSDVFNTVILAIIGGVVSWITNKILYNLKNKAKTKTENEDN